MVFIGFWILQKHCPILKLKKAPASEVKSVKLSLVLVAFRIGARSQSRES